jgi:hypothetical protein
VDARTKTEAVLLAQLGNPWPSVRKLLTRDALWHEQHMGRLNSWELVEQCQYFVNVVWLIDDELELVRTVLHERPKNSRLEAQLVVAKGEPAALTLVGNRIGELGADTGEVDRQGFEGNAGRLDGDMVTGIMEAGAEFLDPAGNQRLAARDDNVPSWETSEPVEDGIDAHRFPGRFP